MNEETLGTTTLPVSAMRVFPWVGPRNTCGAEVAGKGVLVRTSALDGSALSLCWVPGVTLAELNGEVSGEDSHERGYTDGLQRGGQLAEGIFLRHLGALGAPRPGEKVRVYGSSSQDPLMVRYDAVLVQVSHDNGRLASLPVDRVRVLRGPNPRIWDIIARTASSDDLAHVEADTVGEAVGLLLKKHKQYLMARVEGQWYALIGGVVSLMKEPGHV